MKKKLKAVTLKNGYVFNGDKIYLQSMLNKPAQDVKANIKQAKELEERGCHIIRVAIPSLKDVDLISNLKKEVKCPIVADVHFNYTIAIAAVKAGADKIRINPGNISEKEELKKIVSVCKEFKTPIRIGVNAGSLDKEILEKYKKPSIDALVESAVKSVNFFENELDFSNIVVSIKSHNVLDVVFASRRFRELKDNPLHIGVTEAGTKNVSIIKSSIAIGSLLLDGVGETLRVSITGDPIEEVKAGFLILKALEKENKGVEIISCPTCGRTNTDILKITKTVEKSLEGCTKNIKVAIMGCAVNGPGEAKFCDVGIAGGNGVFLLFKKGKALFKVKEEDAVKVLLKEIDKM